MGEYRLRKMNQTTERDVLCGRGGLANNHPGNRIFRRLVDANREQYQSDPNTNHRKLLVKSILLAIRRQSGRFVRKENGYWVEISARDAFVKTSQALREVQDKNQTPKQTQCGSTLPDRKCEPIHTIPQENQEWRKHLALPDTLLLSSNRDIKDSLPTVDDRRTSEESTLSILSQIQHDLQSAANKIEIDDCSCDLEPIPMNEHQTRVSSEFDFLCGDRAKPFDFFDKYL